MASTSTEVDGMPTVRPGEILGGKYRVERVLGSGGMGVVVAATHLQLDEKVALKFLLPDAAASRDIVERFHREAKAAVKIKSEHVARVTDVGMLDNGSPFMVMEYLQGKDLCDTLTDLNHGLPVPIAVEYVLQACEALAEAHAAGIVHRDLKPANLFLTHRADGSPCIKVLDFGISKVLNSVTTPGMTKTTAVMGSPLYMSPEQLKSSKDVDHRTDIWALGAILYELLSGNPPFIADTMPQLCVMIMTQPLTPLRTIRGDIPPDLEGVILRCQAKEPHDRFQNVAELAAALAPFVTGRARLSAERVADVLRTSNASRGSYGSSQPNMAPPAGAPVAPTAPYGVTGASGYQPPQPTVPYVAQAQTGGAFGGQTGGAMGVGATVVGTPHPMMMSTGGTAHPAPPMGAHTASSWEGSMRPSQPKKSSAPLVIGIVAGVLVLGGVGIAVAVLKGGGNDGGGTAALGQDPHAAPTQTTAGPVVTVASDAPVATSEPTASATATSAAPAITGKLPTKTAASDATKATSTATNTPTPSNTPTPTLPTSTKTTTTTKTGGAFDDRH